MKQYYTFGTVDDCTGHWRKLYDCLKKRTKFKDQASAAGASAGRLWQPLQLVLMLLTAVAARG